MLKTFQKGGIHPPENKITAGIQITDLPVPSSVTILLSQHMGAPAKPVVEKGQQVKTGQLIGKGDGFLSGNVHASFSGIISRIDEVQDASGYKRQAVYIEVSGNEWYEGIITDHRLDSEIKLDSAAIIQKISDAGIVGMGGATFPSHVKLTVPRGKKADCIAINGVECEPYLTSDHALMLEKAEEIMVGIRILKKALGVDMAHVGIEANKPDAIALLRQIALKIEGVRIHPLKVKYPQGGEKQLIKSITGREVPSGGLPIDTGVVVFNVGTAYAVYEAVQKNKPLIERIVTVTGKELSQPSNFRVRLGTPVRTLIEAAGGFPDTTGKIIMGGPMMGKAIGSAEVPVVKGTSGILLFPQDESGRPKSEPCIRCGKCVSVCPMGLEPYLLHALSRQDIFDRLETEHVMDCIECGSCSYVCPSARPLLDYIRLGKQNVAKIIRSRRKI